jgi:hypothetical protein
MKYSRNQIFILKLKLKLSAEIPVVKFGRIVRTIHMKTS